MDTPFQFDNYVTGKYFAGRRQDCIDLADNLRAGEHVVIWAPPESGKMSLVQQTLINMRSKGEQFLLCDFDAFNVHSASVFVRRFASEVIKTAGSSIEDMESLVSKCLPSTTLRFDPVNYSASGDIFDIYGPVTESDMDAVARLPYLLANEKKSDIIFIIREIQNIDSDAGEDFYKAMERAMNDNRDASPKCTFVLIGSRVNAMKYLFQRRHFFWGLVKYQELSQISDSEIADYVLKGFNAGGKVIERDIIQDACRLFKNNIWYINIFFFFCNSLTRGYVSELIVADAFSAVLALNRPRFCSIMNNLTDFQEHMVRAVIDGKVKFSTAEVIGNYKLNSSANVKRVKDALLKKEVLAFNDRDEPEFMDPLFEYWLRKEYFNIEEK